MTWLNDFSDGHVQQKDIVVIWSSFRAEIWTAAQFIILRLRWMEEERLEVVWLPVIWGEGHVIANKE